MSQHWIAQVLQEHENAKERHQRYVAVHEAIIQVLRTYEQQRITKAQAIAQLKEAVTSDMELGQAALFRQTIERLQKPHP